jgi:hypothetical protein
MKTHPRISYLGKPTMRRSLEAEPKICVHNVYIRI